MIWKHGVKPYLHGCKHALNNFRVQRCIGTRFGQIKIRLRIESGEKKGDWRSVSFFLCHQIDDKQSVRTYETNVATLVNKDILHRNKG